MVDICIWSSYSVSDVMLYYRHSWVRAISPNQKFYWLSIFDFNQSNIVPGELSANRLSDTVTVRNYGDLVIARVLWGILDLQFILLLSVRDFIFSAKVWRFLRLFCQGRFFFFLPLFFDKAVAPRYGRRADKEPWAEWIIRRFMNRLPSFWNDFWFHLIEYIEHYIQTASLERFASYPSISHRFPLVPYQLLHTRNDSPASNRRARMRHATR